MRSRWEPTSRELEGGLAFARRKVGTARALATVGSAVLAFVVAIFSVTDAAAEPSPAYPRMAAIGAYLMDRADEIALARSAAPESISKDATILVMTESGYEVAVAGSNGFVCMVGRSFGGPSDWPELWNPKVRAAECLNAAAARSIVPIAKLRAAMSLAGRTPRETMKEVEAALIRKDIPPLEPGAMSYMMSRSSYLSDEGEHNMPHLMFFAPVAPGAWGADAADSPLLGGSYWFTADDDGEMSLPTITVFLIRVAKWSDGAPADPQMSAEGLQDPH